MNPTITLISDWRIRDPYLAMFKGQLLSHFPNAYILDVTHHVDTFDIAQTALLTKQTYSSFPAGTVHLLLTNASFTSTFKPVVFEHEQHYFIGEDNGIFHLMFGQTCELKGWQSASTEGNALDRMIGLIHEILKGTLETTASPYNTFKLKLGASLTHFPSQRKIEGEIIYIDAFFNAITNIPVQMFEEATQNANFTASIQTNAGWTIQQYRKTYVNDKDLYLTGNALGLIEVVMYQSKIAILASLEVGNKITITY